MPEGIAVASTTSSQAELEHAASARWREPFVPPAENKDKSESAAAGETQAESETAGKEKTEEGKAGEQKPGTGKNGFEKRIGKLTARNKAVETENAELKARLDALEQRLSGKAETTPATTTPAKKAAGGEASGEPKFEDYKTPNEWLRAHNAWFQETQQRSQEEAESAASVREMWEAHNARLSEARAKYDDFDEVAQTIGDLAVPESAALAIVEQENSADILYYLAQHPDEAKELKEMRPMKQIGTIARLSDKLKGASTSQSAPKPKPQSQAPQPIRPVGGGNTASTADLGSMSYQDYKKARAQGKR